MKSWAGPRDNNCVVQAYTAIVAS